MYVPILKWRQGEYLALERLESDIKDEVMPLVEIPPIGWDFERGCLAKTIDEHLEKFSHRYRLKWGGRHAFVDLLLLDPSHRMSDNSHPVSYIFKGLRQNVEHVIPVTGLSRDSDYQEAVRKVVEEDNNGLSVRLLFEDIVKSDVNVLLEALSIFHNINFGDMDIVLDLESPNFHPIGQFARALLIAILRLPKLSQFRTFTIVATSFPKSMGKMKKGSQIIERSEWLLYQALITMSSKLEVRPQFGDYAIAYPLLPEQDMRLLKPAASLRYTVEGGWYIGKGTNVRDNGFGQYVDICKSLVRSGYFLGQDFSKGDMYIFECSERRGSTGNLSVWRWVGTNHHITRVVHDLASFHGT